ncbi:MAG: pyridoxine 5'-phosphate synthase [Planctomycetes bacterium]|nr:pyridoxine 5'-phosphate synthase [Planctomycetota bacterium]
MTALSVNVNKIALLRNCRDIGIPSVLQAAQTCIEAGCQGITVHPRPDQRHIRPADVYELNEMLTTEAAVEFNIEGNPLSEPRGDYPGFMEIVHRVKPDQCTLVPDSPDQSTSDHGWDLARDGELVKPLVAKLKDLGIRVSLFMDAVADNMRLAAEVGADRVELYTESYARAFSEGRVDDVFEQFAASAAAARQAGLGVNAGHDLNLDNLARFCTIEGILEVSIGHALIADALEMGLSKTVKAYLAALGR